MSEFILTTVKQEVTQACTEALDELDQRELELDETISELVIRKADLTRKREVFTSLMAKRQLGHQRPRLPSLSPQVNPSPPKNRPATSEAERTNQLANTPESHTKVPIHTYRLLDTSPPKRTPVNRAEERYRAILGAIAEQVADDTEPPAGTNRPSQAFDSLPGFEQQSKFPGFSKARGDTYLAYRLSSGNRGDFEKVRRYNEYFTRHPFLARDSHCQPVIYVLDVEWFLETFFDEIRHIESCVRYQAANWKNLQAKIVMNESYRVLIQLIDEAIDTYSPALQVSPPLPEDHAGAPNRVRVRTAKGTEQEVDISRLTRKDDRLFLDRTEVAFAGYLKQDINVIFPVATFDVMNPHILKLMRQELTQHQYVRAVEYWRACEIRIQELGKHYESGLLGQLRTWLT
ncbi:MAG: hypothetical protein O7E52_13770 [Candidatus Poribacteria bacterium]|nr:hypothetical protein [Candidatus Poribacteria bacterium]